MTGVEGMALGFGLLVLVAVVMGLFRKQKNGDSPHEDIPSRSEIPTLWKAILSHPDMRPLTVKRHHRGAIYWHCIDKGFTADYALELALSPEASSVEYDVSYG